MNTRKVSNAANRLFFLVDQGLEYPTAEYKVVTEFELNDQEQMYLRKVYDAAYP